MSTPDTWLFALYACKHAGRLSLTRAAIIDEVREMADLLGRYDFVKDLDDLVALSGDPEEAKRFWKNYRQWIKRGGYRAQNEYFWRGPEVKVLDYEDIENFYGAMREEVRELVRTGRLRVWFDEEEVDQIFRKAPAPAVRK